VAIVMVPKGALRFTGVDPCAKQDTWWESQVWPEDSQLFLASGEDSSLQRTRRAEQYVFPYTTVRQQAKRRAQQHTTVPNIVLSSHLGGLGHKYQF